MARPKVKNGQRMSFYLDTELVNRFKAYCAEVGQPQTVALERMIKTCLDAREKRRPGVKEKPSI